MRSSKVKVSIKVKLNFGTQHVSRGTCTYGVEHDSFHIPLVLFPAVYCDVYFLGFQRHETRLSGALCSAAPSSTRMDRTASSVRRAATVPSMARQSVQSSRGVSVHSCCAGAAGQRRPQGLQGTPPRHKGTLAAPSSATLPRTHNADNVHNPERILAGSIAMPRPRSTPIIALPARGDALLTRVLAYIQP